jgi:hypothetical protein
MSVGGMTIYGNHVIGIVLGFEIKNERRISDSAQCGRCKQGSLVAMGRVLTQYAARRPGAVLEVVRHVVEGPLNALGSLQRAQLAEFSRGQTPGVAIHPRFPVETL